MAATITGTSVGRVKPTRLIGLEQHKDERGCVSVVESDHTAGFPVERVYFLHDLASGTSRGGHAHRQLEQLFIAAHGSFTIRLDDGHHQAEYELNDPGTGLYVGPMVWRDLSGFSDGGVCLVLASQHYEEADYYRDYEEFLRDSRQFG
ncbi:FdtA/QdtA family cupin domain-containing protein [Streptomyces sp. NBC_01387]|uniref:sugar 3,4-ketoisomerase n=1 Tax=unclassified Streptomyces TaxID=2593676 RepID=UPI002024E0AC|nr:MULTISPECIES: FdtA/QdtA family cupin domain-containing protein [unclassified Streptomyces]MCX4547584.1 FdtA/QdtA family cupin domain-containing protein [Streptomyces sp. NBC_01500]WSC19271.1 FdtA/QdtA family cupin domain-containing protein [Streptomyces sp. NBC_01766]WSV53294.1 FdtA/QdtA family cupin domain-containing protein [Streptomyces sp. NBC_01014]